MAKISAAAYLRTRLTSEFFNGIFCVHHLSCIFMNIISYGLYAKYVMTPSNAVDLESPLVTGLAGWPFLGQISKILPRFKLVGLKNFSWLFGPFLA